MLAEESAWWVCGYGEEACQEFLIRVKHSTQAERPQNLSHYRNKGPFLAATALLQ